MAAWPGDVIAGPDSAGGWNLGLFGAAAGSPAGGNDGLRRDRPVAGRPGPGPSHGIDGTWCRHPGLDRVLNEVRRAEDALRSGEETIGLRSRVAGRIADLEARLAEARQCAGDDEAEQKLVERLESVRGQRGQHFDPHAAMPNTRRPSATPGSTSTRPTPSKRAMDQATAEVDRNYRRGGRLVHDPSDAFVRDFRG